VGSPALLAAAAAALLAAADPGAAPPRLAVAALDAPADLRFTGKKVAGAVAAEAAAAGELRVITPEDVERRLGLAATTALVRCGDDPRCLAERAAPLAVDLVVGGFLARTGDAYRLVVVQVEVATARVVGRIDRRVPVGARGLEDEAARATAALLAGEADRPGRLTVVTEEPGVSVAVDGAAVGTTPITRTVAPGRHEVRVWGEGLARADPVWVDVPSGGEVVHRPRVYDLPARDQKRRPDRTRVEVVR
jgi:serine/threonine-protein kinase